MLALTLPAPAPQNCIGSVFAFIAMAYGFDADIEVLTNLESGELNSATRNQASVN
jgi:hypothetical protein